VKFTPPVRNERYRNVIILDQPPTRPRRHWCRNRLAGGSLFTPGEAPPPPNRTVTWSFAPHASADVAPNGDFSFRPRRTVPGRLRRWCPGVYHGRLDVEHWNRS
jgi:hypothetical protein